MKPTKNLTSLFLFCGMLVSFSQPVKKEAGAAFPEEKKVIDLSIQSINEEKINPQTMDFEDQSTYKYSVSLPNTWKVKAMGEETLDYCAYEAKLPDGTKVLEISGMLNTRFTEDNIQDLYRAALKTTQLKITYKLQKDNWFVISGVDNKTGNIIYFKRVLGEQFVSDLGFNYPKSKEAQVAPYIGRIAKSFDSM